MRETATASVIVRRVDKATRRCPVHGRRRDGSSNSVAASVAVLMDGNVDDPVRRCRNGVARGHVLAALAGPARFDPVRR